MAESTTPKFDSAVFGVEATNHELLKIAYESYLAENRQVGAKTLTRGKVRGGGKKPWRQKGTGRARFGSSRNPIWRGGGVVFGPLGIENYSKKLAKNTKRVALRQALTLAKNANKVTIATGMRLTGKTRDAVKFLAAEKADDARRVLLVVSEKTPEILRSTSNLANIELVRPTYLTVYHILNADRIIFVGDSLDQTTAWLKGDK